MVLSSVWVWVVVYGLIVCVGVGGWLCMVLSSVCVCVWVVVYGLIVCV